MGYCAYPDPTCPGLLRYDRDAGGFAELCVGESRPSGFSVSAGTAQTGDAATMPTSGETGGPLTGTQGETASSISSSGEATAATEGPGDNCGAAGEPCCADSTCDAPLACRQNMCTCVEALVAGDRHSCALLTNDDIYCWGANDVRQLRSTTNPFESRPILVRGSTGDPVVSIEATNHTCIRTAQGWGECWGANASGQVHPTMRDAFMADTAGWASNVAQLAVGTNHTCAGDEAQVLCWGNNGRYQLTTSNPGPGPIAAVEEPVDKIALGGFHSCVLRSGGIACWGDNAYGQAGVNPANGSLLPDPRGLALTDVTALALGRHHTCAVDTLGTIGCWGRNDLGQLGDGGAMPQAYQPVEVVISESVGQPAQLVAGPDHTCVLGETGELWCWGSNDFGQLMLKPDVNGFDAYTTVPVRVDVGAGVLMIATGQTHSCALTDGGQVVCWGTNTQGQVGDGSTNYALRPREVALVCPEPT